MDAILRALGIRANFPLRKVSRRSGADGKGQVVVDETPIGNFCEIEGPPRWIDATAKKLGVPSRIHHQELRNAVHGLEAGNEEPSNEMTFKAVKR